MKLSDAQFTGGCLCGQVRVKLQGDPLWTATCHCADCRRATGAAAVTFAGYAENHASIEGNSFRECETSKDNWRGFCSNCGSTMSYRSATYPGEIHLHVGILDNPDHFAPKADVFVRDKLDWIRLDPDLPAIRTTTKAQGESD